MNLHQAPGVHGHPFARGCVFSRPCVVRAERRGGIVGSARLVLVDGGVGALTSPGVDDVVPESGQGVDLALALSVNVVGVSEAWGRGREWPPRSSYVSHAATQVARRAFGLAKAGRKVGHVRRAVLAAATGGGAFAQRCDQRVQLVVCVHLGVVRVQLALGAEQTGCTAHVRAAFPNLAGEPAGPRRGWRRGRRRRGWRGGRRRRGRKWRRFS